MDKIKIAKALKKARNNMNMTCKDVALLVGKSEKTISAWEHCNGQPDAGTLFQLCKIYKMSSIDEMLECVSENNLFNTLRVEEKDLISAYRKLTTNSKQIVMTVAQMELNHVLAVEQSEKPIKIIQKTKQQLDDDIKLSLKHEPYMLKVFTQSAAAGYGNYIDDDSFEMIAVPCIPNGTEFGIRITGDSMQPQINDGDIVFVKRQSSIEIGEIGIFIYNGNAYCKQLAYHDNTYYLHSLNSKYKDIPILGDSIYTVGYVLDNYNEDI